MRVIRLNGTLGRKYGKVHRLDVKTPAEAVRALCANYPGLEQDLISSHERGVAYKCIVDYNRVEEEHLHYPMSRTFTITPVVHGGGKVLGIILGVVLIGAALVLSGGLAGAPLSAALGGSIGFAGLTYGSIALVGAALVLGGIAQLLAPTPKMDTSGGKTNENNYFNGPVNSTAQGAAIPIGYGRCIIGSAVISAGIVVEQQGYSGGYEDLPIRGFDSNWNYV